MRQGFQGQRQRPGLCFACGKPGHWKIDCVQNSSNNKISTKFLKAILTEKSKKNVSKPLEKVVTHLKDENDNKEVINISPVGRLKKYIKNWEEISDNQYILDIIQNGYKIPFKETPADVELRNNKSARDNHAFVLTEMNTLLEKGVISEVKEKPKVINPLTVAYNRAGKPRLVLDCRHINKCIHLFRVKFEDIKVALEMFDLNSFIYTFDLKSAYHHIDIFAEHRTFLGFSVKERGTDKYFVYNSLPFGIASAGHIFTKTLRCVIKHWRRKGHRIVMFLDDGIGVDKSYKTALESSRYVRNSLIDLGFLLAENKCI